MMDEEGVPIWYVFNQSDMCSPEQPERLYIKTVDMRHLIAYVPEDARTCHMKLLENIHTSAYQDVYECDECGEQVLRETYMGKSEPPKFCPACGRKVIGIREETE